MRFLFLTTIYPAPGDSYMTSELAHALRGRGHEVEVLHINWRAETGTATRERDDNGVRVVDVAPRAFQRFGKVAYRISKFLRTSRHSANELSDRFELDTFDALVAWTPALTASGSLRRAQRAGIAKRLLFVFDFFPIHHREIGTVPGGPIYIAAKRMEEALLRRFTTIICNLSANISYLRRNYRIAPDQRVVFTPLWSVIDTLAPPPAGEIRIRYGLPEGEPIAIFGGQMVEGRGIELMLDAACEAEKAGSALQFLFVGNGRLANLLAQAAKDRGNVHYLPAVPREEYGQLVVACDVGMVATVAGVSSFSFPTKTIDYLRGGLPVVAAVEDGSDYLEILTGHEVGEGVGLSDAKGYFEALERQVAAADVAFAQRARKALKDVFDVRHTADLVVAEVERSETGSQG